MSSSTLIWTGHAWHWTPMHLYTPKLTSPKNTGLKQDPTHGAAMSQCPRIYRQHGSGQWSDMGKSNNKFQPIKTPYHSQMTNHKLENWLFAHPWVKHCPMSAPSFTRSHWATIISWSVMTRLMMGVKYPDVTPWPAPHVPCYACQQLSNYRMSSPGFPPTTHTQL